MRLRLRTMLVIVMLAAVAVNFLATKYQSVRRNIQGVEALGGRVCLESICDSEGIQDPPGLPTFGLLSQAFDALLCPFDRIASVDFSETEISDSDLSMLRDFDGLIRLDLSGTRITDNGLKQLENLRGLRFIDVSGTQVTNLGGQKLKASLSPDLQIIYDSESALAKRLVEKIKEVWNQDTND